MKTTLRLLLFPALIIFCFTSCEQQAVLEFEEPQPANVKNATEFKKKFRGNYLSLEDSSVLQIHPKLLLRTNAYYFRIAKNEIDTMKGWKISGQKLYSPDFQQGVSFSLQHDSVHFTLNSTDTLFRTGAENISNNILRFYKGRYYLNRRTAENRWQLSSLGFDKDGKLLYAAVTDSTDLENMQQFTVVTGVQNEEGKTVAHIARPAQKEFRKFMKKSGFHKQEAFVRIGKRE